MSVVAVHSLYLMRVDWEQRAAASRAIHSARKALGIDGTSHSVAFDIVKRCYNEGGPAVPSLIGHATSNGVLKLAQGRLDEAADAKLLIYATDPTPEEVLAPQQAIDADEPPAPTPLIAGGNPDDVYEPEVYETAMMLLVGMRGNPFGALSLAGGLARTTRSDSFKRVQNCILRIFPADNAVAAALVQQVMDDNDDA